MVFISIAGYWAVEATEETAMNGVWKKGPGKDLFDVLEKVISLSSFCSLSELNISDQLKPFQPMFQTRPFCPKTTSFETPAACKKYEYLCSGLFKFNEAKYNFYAQDATKLFD